MFKLYYKLMAKYWAKKWVKYAFDYSAPIYPPTRVQMKCVYRARTMYYCRKAGIDFVEGNIAAQYKVTPSNFY